MKIKITGTANQLSSGDQPDKQWQLCHFSLWQLVHDKRRNATSGVVTLIL